jgi:hypothetical protein
MMFSMHRPVSLSSVMDRPGPAALHHRDKEPSAVLDSGFSERFVSIAAVRWSLFSRGCVLGLTDQKGRI